MYVCKCMYVYIYIYIYVGALYSAALRSTLWAESPRRPCTAGAPTRHQSPWAKNETSSASLSASETECVQLWVMCHSTNSINLEDVLLKELIISSDLCDWSVARIDLNTWILWWIRFAVVYNWSNKSNSFIPGRLRNQEGCSTWLRNQEVGPTPYGCNQEGCPTWLEPIGEMISEMENKNMTCVWLSTKVRHKSDPHLDVKLSFIYINTSRHNV